MNYYPFHIGDYASATRHLSWEEDLAYRRLLDVYYTTEKPLPLDSRQVYRLVLATSDSQREAVTTILAEFFTKTDDGWTHGRADAEIATMRDKQQKQREKAQRMWANRKQQMPVTESGNAPAMPQQTGNDATASPRSAEAMPPTPTPTPTPTPKVKGERASALPRPDDIDPQTWSDWTQLRRAKHAPITATVLAGARSEAEKAGLTLAEFLRVWCTRGSQGLQASWLRDDERRQQRAPPEPAWRVEQRQRTQLAAPGVAVQSAPDFFDVEASRVTSE